MFFIFIGFAWSCEPVARNEIRFEAPQPEGSKTETSFPKKLLGHYQMFDEVKTTLIITQDRVIRKNEADSTFLFNALDSVDRAEILSDTASASQKKSPTFYVKIVGDSVYTHFAFIDTLFCIPDGDVLKKFKGYYLLNNGNAQYGWAVRKLGVVNAGVLLSSVSSSQDLERLQVLTNAPSDTVYTFRPTRRQFKKFMAKRDEQHQSLYIKIPSRQKH